CVFNDCKREPSKGIHSRCKSSKTSSPANSNSKVMFDHIVGNEPIKGYFLKALRSNLLPSAILISGQAGLGKSLFAQSLASALLKTDKLESHPDFHRFRPESKSGLHSI